MILYFIIEDLKILFTEKLSQTRKKLSKLVKPPELSNIR